MRRITLETQRLLNIIFFEEVLSLLLLPRVDIEMNLTTFPFVLERWRYNNN